VAAKKWEQTAGIHLAPYSAWDSTAKSWPRLFFSRVRGSRLTGDVAGLVPWQLFASYGALP
jgi:hypothetical protein